MSTVPSGTRFIGISERVNLTERKSALLNSDTQPFTIQDIADTVGVGSIGPQGNTGPTGPQGPVGPAGLEWRGPWVSGTSYIADDAVGYGGASYFCILATSGTTTPNLATTNWALLASQGAIGPTGPAGPTGPQGPSGGAGTLQQTVTNGNTINDGVTTMTVLADSIKTNDFLGGKIELVSTAGDNPYLKFALPSSAGKTVTLTSADSQTASRTIKLPDASGTVALTSDITGTNVTKVIKTTITSAQILNLFTTPITVLDAFTPNLKYPVNIYIRRNIGNGYTLANNMFSIVDEANVVVENSIDASFLAFNYSSSTGFTQKSLSIDVSSGNEDRRYLYKLKANVGNPTLGTGNFDVYVTYIEITL